MTSEERDAVDIDELAAASGWGEVLAALADADAVTPPAPIRGALLAEAARRPRAGAEPVPAPEVYAGRVTAIGALFDELEGDDWAAEVEAYGWSVHRLVAHLTVIEEYTARQFGLTDEPPATVGDPSVSDHLAIGGSTVDGLVAGDPDATVARWRAAAERLVAHATGPSFEANAPVPLHAWPFGAATALIVRSFEIWTHDDDIRRATGRPLSTPPPGELRTISSTSIGGLPALLALGGEAAMTPTRVVLTGPGGGSFDLGVAGDDQAPNLLVADVVDYCRVVARRLEPEALDGVREGDVELLSALLRAAQAIAV